MSHNSQTTDGDASSKSPDHDMDKAQNADKVESASNSESGGESAGSDRSTWVENMVHDQSTEELVQTLLRTELQKVRACLVWLVTLLDI
jgi:hypothetical protein